jgi:hypothetical protein
MLMLEVRCPHCNVRGQVILPPLGSIIVGPCPNCEELVVIFCGRVLPLIKEVMVTGTDTEKRAHLKEALISFIDDRVKKIVDQLTLEVTEGLRDYTPEDEEDTPPPVKPSQNTITAAEIDFFLKSELPKIDQKKYFRRNLDNLS